MNIPEEFGNYLLLKKLTEDPLGETFRAGRVGETGTMEQVVLLRVFNGKGLDGEKLWTRISGQAAVQQVLKSPNIGSGVDLGRVRSFPYVAYDYISGKNLATVFAQSARQLSPIPTDHALLIAERISLALAAAHESRVQDERVLHGFVVPHLVMISNEGETRLLGFEAAPGLRDLASGNWQDETTRSYLSPETLTGTPVGKADDVYSLGAILFELLTGERLPMAPAGGYGSVIDGAVTANEGTPFPEPVAALLKKSLVPREQRIADAVTWHKTLSKLMIDGHFSPTTFNLAFFMHNLFREEIERESHEIQAEQRLELPKKPAPAPVVPIAAAAPVAASAPAVTDMRETTGVRQGTLPGTRMPAAAQSAAEPSKRGLWIGLAAAAVLALAAGGWFLFLRPAGEMQTAGSPPPPISTTIQQAAMPGAVPPGPANPAAPAAPSPEEIQAQIQQMFEARQKEMESKLQTQYDDRIKELQRQLEDSRRAGAEPSRPAYQEPAPAPAPAVTETRKPEPPPPSIAAIETKKPEPAPVQTAPAVPAPSPAQAEREEKPAGSTGSTTAPANPVPAPAQRQQQVQMGDLVQPGPGVSAPKLVSRLDPRYPPAAQRMKRAAQVDIKVLVDEKGRVLDAERIGTKAGFGFDESALDAARRATFQPAVKEGVKVKMWTTLRVNFKGM